MKIYYFLILLGYFVSAAYNTSTQKSTRTQYQQKALAVATVVPKPKLYSDTLAKTIHIFVALCDNKYQGIVPVPKKIGNGQDINNNLYWGCGYGIRSYFKNSKEWTLLQTLKPGNNILQRLVFKNNSTNYYLIADAYDGQFIQQCTEDFLRSSCGAFKGSLAVAGTTIGMGGNANLVAYIGHDGLMDFNLDETFKNNDGKRRDVIVLACFSKMFFEPHLKNANVNPLVWTTHLMCPEAYTIHDALIGYINKETNAAICRRAVKAYNKYQKCGEKAAGKLLVTGW